MIFLQIKCPELPDLSKQLYRLKSQKCMKSIHRTILLVLPENRFNIIWSKADELNKTPGRKEVIFKTYFGGHNIGGMRP